MTSARRRAAAVAATASLVLLLPAQAGAAAPGGGPAPAAADDLAVYTVPHTDSRIRTDINASGAQVLGAKNDVATVEATGRQAEQLRARGLVLQRQATNADVLAQRSGGGTRDFPPGDEAYHNYDEMVAELDKAAADHPNLAVKSSIGKSFEQRDIPVLKISDNPGQDENEPEVLFDCNQHAREHLTTEMCLRVVNRLTDNYNDPAVKNMVDNREIWVIPSVNVDGSAYDVASGQYQGWRKNRQGPGTDVNRNWGYKWGCCGGASDDPQEETYRGTGPFSAPESAAIARFIDSRVVDGRQQIKSAIDFHTFSELVLWPFGHTPDDVTEGMTQQEYDRFSKVGHEIAGTNGYTPQQSSDLYTTDGDSLDWMWGKHKILAFTLEMYPSSGGLDGFYPPANVIDRETARNDKAVDIVIREAGA